MTNLVEGPFDAERVRNLRDVLTASGAGIYLAAHLAGPLPAESLAAARESDEMDLRVGRVGPDRSEDLLQRDREARAVAAAVVQAAPERMVIVHGSAEGARLVALAALADRAERRSGAIVAIGDQQPSVLAALRGVAEACSAPFEIVEADAPSLPDAGLIALALVGSDGTLLDVPRLTALGHANGARVLLDASLAVGATPVDLQSLGVDALVADLHRWLLGPESTAVAWLGAAFGDDVPAALRQASAPFARGTLVSLARSVSWLLMYAELPWMLQRTRLLVERLLRGLSDVPGVELLTHPQRHAALIAFRIGGWAPEQAAEELSRSVFAILEADDDVLRIGPGAWNREEELDRFLERVREIAAHTPATLPRRPTLTVLSGPSVPEP